MCKKRDISKADVADMLDRYYVRGSKTLDDIATFFGCSTVRIKQIGKQLVPGYSEAAKTRNRNGPKNRACKHKSRTL